VLGGGKVGNAGICHSVRSCILYQSEVIPYEERFCVVPPRTRVFLKITDLKEHVHLVLLKTWQCCYRNL
jgi:hypothetical protein